MHINGRQVELIHGDAAKEIPTLEGLFGAVITDPPYASGAATLAGKQAGSARKYTETKRKCPMPDFEGDGMDQRSWTRLMTDVLRAARAKCAPRAVLCAFSDWRQLPALTDAMQWAGWLWRGTAVWDKINSRPQKGRFRQQAEFIAWASNGPMPVTRQAPILPAVLSYSGLNMPDRIHQTQKPLDLMRQIVRICEPDGRILDPFAGSGTTLLAAALEGHDSVGIELSDAYYNAALTRLQHTDFE
jgi:site-specific DNA-methyltransferase (adenine-specific)